MASLLEEFQDQQTRSLTGRLKAVKKAIEKLEKDTLGEGVITAEDKLTFKDVIAQIQAATRVGSKPKREEFIDAAKEYLDIARCPVFIPSAPKLFL